jgi:signal peptidase I
VLPRFLSRRKGKTPAPLDEAGEPVRERKPFRVPYFGRSKDGTRRQQQRFRLLRDLFGAVVILAVVLGALYVASGGLWPPVLVVESGSMMHEDGDTPYGRVGTIDVGDIVFLRAIDGPRDVRTWADGGDEHYGRAGDVIAYAPNGDRADPAHPIIVHRAMAFVDVVRAANVSTTYYVHWVDGKVLSFGPAGIYMPVLGFDESFGYTPDDGYKPLYSGFLTKGDNAATNFATDQAANLSGLVDPAWIDGTVHGEIPWMGLGKLALQWGQTNPQVDTWTRIGNAFAPLELWYMFFLVVGLIILVPFTIDTWKLWRQYRVRKREHDAVENEMAEQRRRAIVEFQPIRR